MALQPGMLRVTVEYAKGLKDADLFSKNDPYAVVRVGSQQAKTRTLQGAGTDPVWNETFTFQVINENVMDVIIYDEDVVSDDLLGNASISLAKVRTARTDHVQAPVIRPKTKKQKGYVSISMVYDPNGNQQHQQQHQQQQYGAGYPAAAPSGYPAQPQPYAYGAPAAYPPQQYPPPSAGAPGGYPPQQYPQQYPQQSGASQPGPPPAGYPGGGAPQYAQGIPYGAPQHSYPGAYGAPPPGYPQGAPAGGAYYPPGGHGGPTPVVVHSQPQRPQKPHKPQRFGGGGTGLALGGGLLGGLLLGGMMGDMGDCGDCGGE